MGGKRIKHTLKIFFIGAICLGLSVFSCSDKKQRPFSFVQLCDTQLGMGGYEHDLKTFMQAVNQINRLKPDFAVICGDLVHNATDSSYADFKSILKAFEIPCYLAPGNHDVGNVPNASTLAYYREKIGKDYFTFSNKGMAFMVVNTQLWKENVIDESEKHHQWFVNTLDSLTTNEVSKFVVGHYPIFLKSPEEQEEYFNLPLDRRREILNLFEQHKVKGYLSGHKHELLINTYKGIQFVSGESTSKNFDKRPLGFRLWQISSDSIYHSFVTLHLK